MFKKKNLCVKISYQDWKEVREGWTLAAKQMWEWAQMPCSYSVGTIQSQSSKRGEDGVDNAKVSEQGLEWE